MGHEPQHVPKNAGNTQLPSGQNFLLHRALHRAESRSKIRGAPGTRPESRPRRFRRADPTHICSLAWRGSYEHFDAISRQPGNDKSFYDSLPGPRTIAYRNQVSYYNVTCAQFPTELFHRTSNVARVQSPLRELKKKFFLRIAVFENKALNCPLKLDCCYPGMKCFNCFVSHPMYVCRRW